MFSAALLWRGFNLPGLRSASARRLPSPPPAGAVNNGEGGRGVRPASPGDVGNVVICGGGGRARGQMPLIDMDGGRLSACGGRAGRVRLQAVTTRRGRKKQSEQKHRRVGGNEFPFANCASPRLLSRFLTSRKCAKSLKRRNLYSTEPTLFLPRPVPSRPVIDASFQHVQPRHPQG